MCASTTVVNPCEIPQLTNSRNSDTPVMMSAFIIGMALAKFITRRVRVRRLKMPMAAMLPNAVLAVAASMAMANVFQMALVSEWCMPPVKRELYSLVENPVQLPSTLASVKENTMMIRIGEYSSASSSHRYPLARIRVIISHLRFHWMRRPLRS